MVREQMPLIQEIQLEHLVGRCDHAHAGERP